MEGSSKRPLFPVTSWVGSVWGLRQAKGDVIGEVRAVQGEMLALAILGAEGDSARSVKGDLPSETSGREVRVSTKSLLSQWEHVDRGRARFWRRYRPVR
jgi:hypothetical protein